MGRHKGPSAPFTLFAFQDIITSVTGIILLITMMMAVELVHNMTKADAAPQEQKSSQVKRMLQQAVGQSSGEADRLQKILDETTTIRFDADALQRRLEQLKATAAELASQQEKLKNTQEKIDARREQQKLESRDITPEAIEALTKEQAEIAQQLEAMQKSNRVIFNRPAGAEKTPWLVELNETSILAAEMGQSRPPETFQTPEEFVQWVKGQNPDSMYFVLLVKPSSISAFSIVRQALQQQQFEIGYDLMRSDQTAIDAKTGAGAP
ncbi:MAG: hypothetical protein JNM43_06155 [Planctomycetaceae bacterium]|nr:hypothetical protein [Planctomycetaceae bacterium]